MKKGQNEMTKEETAVNISAIKKYIEKTKVPEEILKHLGNGRLFCILLVSA